jgi:hypothetical protein
MRKDLPVLRFRGSALRGVRIRRRSLQAGFGFQFMGVPTEQGFHFIQVGFRSRANALSTPGRAGAPRNARVARLRQLSPVLRRALAAAAQRAQRRQVQLRREELIEQLCSRFMDRAAVAEWLDRLLSLSEADQGPLHWGLS